MNVKEVKADLQERKHQNEGHEVSFILSPRWRAALVLQAWWRSTKVPAMARPPADEDEGRGIEACMSPLRCPPAPPLAPLPHAPPLAPLPPQPATGTYSLYL